MKVKVSDIVSSGRIFFVLMSAASIWARFLISWRFEDFSDVNVSSHETLYWRWWTMTTTHADLLLQVLSVSAPVAEEVRDG